MFFGRRSFFNSMEWALIAHCALLLLDSFVFVFDFSLISNITIETFVRRDIFCAETLVGFRTNTCVALNVQFANAVGDLCRLNACSKFFVVFQLASDFRTILEHAS
jgi:hypothetical protein